LAGAATFACRGHAAVSATIALLANLFSADPASVARNG